MSVICVFMKFILTAWASWGIFWSLAHSSCQPLAESAFSQCQNLPSSPLPFSHGQPGKRMLPAAVKIHRVKRGRNTKAASTPGAAEKVRRMLKSRRFYENFVKIKSEKQRWRLFPWWTTCFLFTFDLLVQRLSWTRWCTANVDGEMSDWLA